MKRHIDVHAHAFSRTYVDLLERLGAAPDVISPARMVVAATPDADLRDRLAHMDAGGVERAVLSMSAATPYFDDPGAAIQAARFLNDEQAARCREHPERFSSSQPCRCRTSTPRSRSCSAQRRNSVPLA